MGVTAQAQPHHSHNTFACHTWEGKGILAEHLNMATFTSADIERVRATTAALVDEYHAPGVSIGVVVGDELVYAEGFGYADIESGRPQSPELRQRIGSITKTMVGLCAMALVDEGKLDLDERVVDRLPEIRFNGPGETLRIRHLMTHSNGIGEAPTMRDFHDTLGKLWSNSPTPTPVSQMYPDGIDVEVPAGTKWAYANHAFCLLGEIIARIEGRRIEEVLERRVYGPLGMANSDCYDQQRDDLTTGYHHAPSHDDLDAMSILGVAASDAKPVDGHNIRGEYVYVATRAAGAVQSTIPDMARYASALLAKGKGIVSPETFDLMTSPQWCPDERLLNLGLTFMRLNRFGRPSFGHGGGISGGWNTHIDIFPTENLAVLTHLNIGFDGSDQIFSKVIQSVLDEPTPVLTGSPISAGAAANAVGVYEPPPGFLTSYRTIRSAGRIQITERDGGLELRSRRGAWREGVRLVQPDPNDPGHFLLDTGAPEPPGLVLQFGGSGKANGILLPRMNLVRNDNLAAWI